jgi:hypothetical protein
VLFHTSKIKPSHSDFTLKKLHDKKVVIVTKMKLEIEVMLTISIDGYAKLWKKDYENLFALKLPNLFKASWNMRDIHLIKN